MAVPPGLVHVRRQEPLHVADHLVALPLVLGQLLGRVVGVAERGPPLPLPARQRPVAVVLGVNSMALLKSQQTFQQTFQQSF